MLKWSLKTSYMKKRIIIRGLKILLIIIALVIVGERIYNRQDKFQTRAEAPSHYGILDVGFTSKEKLMEFDYLVSVLKDNYPFFKVNERIKGINWLDKINSYKRILRNTENDAEYLVALNNILDELNDRSTYALTGDDYKLFYNHYKEERKDILNYQRSLIRYEFDGNLNVLTSKNSIFYDGPVLDIRSINDHVAYMKIDQMSYYKIDEDLPQIRAFLKKVEDYDKLIIDIRGNSGGLDDYWIKIVELLIDDPHQAEYYSFFKQTSKTNRDVFKIPGITTLADMDKDLLDKFPQEVKEDFNFYKLNTLEVNPSNEIDFKGKIYLLVDRDVYSSAEKFAAFSKDTSFATLVGETTGGGMNFEEVPMVNLSYGGFIINYSREMAMNSDFTINMETRTRPDILVDDASINQDISLDKCIQAVLGQ